MTVLLFPRLGNIAIVCLSDESPQSGREWRLVVSLMCVALKTRDAERLFMCVLTICPTLEKNLLKSYAHLESGCLVTTEF